MNGTIVMMPVAQAGPWDDGGGAPSGADGGAVAGGTDGSAGGGGAGAGHTLTFSDFTHGLRDYNAGKGKSSTGSGVLIGIVAVVVLGGVLLQLRQRRRESGPPDSDRKLGWELLRASGLGWGTRGLLLWVARSTGWPVAALIISATAFDKAVGEWSGRPTFGPARHWGKGRLAGVRGRLFGE